MVRADLGNAHIKGNGILFHCFSMVKEDSVLRQQRIMSQASVVSAGGKEGKNGDVLPDNIAFVDQEPQTSVCQLLNTFIL